MYVRPVLLSFLIAAFFAPQMHAADDQQQLRDRLKDAAQNSALDGKGMPAWHWKLDFTLFDKDETNPRSGTLEMWFLNGSMRTTVSVGTEQVTAIRSGEVLYRTSGNENLLLSGAFLQLQLLHPIPDQVSQPAVSVALKSVDAGSLKLDCIAPTFVKPTNHVISIGPPFSFCFVRDTTRLVASYGSGGVNVFRAQLGTFQSHDVPMELQILAGKTKVAEVRTTKLASEAIDPALLDVTPEMTRYVGPVESKQANLRLLQLSGNPPVYPEVAKLQHISGIVTFNAVIGKDGRIASLQPTGAPDSILTRAATNAVSGWLYRPFEINGVAFEVKTQLTVNFNFGPA